MIRMVIIAMMMIPEVIMRMTIIMILEVEINSKMITITTMIILVSNPIINSPAGQPAEWRHIDPENIQILHRTSRLHQLLRPPCLSPIGEPPPLTHSSSFLFLIIPIFKSICFWKSFISISCRFVQILT